MLSLLDCEETNEILVHIASVNREGSDKPTHLHSLARAFAAGIHKI